MKSSPDGVRSRCKKCRVELAKKWNNRRNETARVKYPTPHDKCVYAFKEGDEIVYIGSSDATSFRLYRHFNCHQTFDDGLNKLQREAKYSWHILWHGNNMDDAHHQEKLNIQLHQPKFNKILYKNYEG